MSPKPRKPASVPASDPAARLRQAAQNDQLVVVIGTGVSLGLTNNTIPALSWKGLIRDAFEHGIKKGLVTNAQARIAEAQLESTDLDDLLAAADFISHKLGGPNGDLYARWLKQVFSGVQPSNPELAQAVDVLHRAGIPLCTLNYDLLLERITGLPSITLADTSKVYAWMQGQGEGVLHLHGSWDQPATCVLGVRDYEKTLTSENRDLIQRSLASFQRLLFIGCGDTFADPNFSALIKWQRLNVGAASLEHYGLVADGDLAARHADPAWQGFVEPLSYGPSRDALAGFLTAQLGDLAAEPAADETPARRVSVSEEQSHLLTEYRRFLLKDCGQMTIEGLRADMDMAQRRFDLERLFVPIEVLVSTRPEPSGEADHAEKSRRGSRDDGRDDGTKYPFGEAFAEHPRMVLQALPGGGKSMLLKRVAVAYADRARRDKSVDSLPDLDLTPVVIRCREWREHIHRPILTLLSKLPDITGQPSLSGLNHALLPLFEDGRALLLVDGLDEILDGGQRTTFVDHLENFLTEYDKIRAIITSREAGFSLVAPSLVRFCALARIAPFTPPAIEAFSMLWHRLMGNDSPESIAEANAVSKLLIGQDSLRRLAENPLLLTMLLVVKQGEGRVPQERVTLYKRAVDVLLDTWNIRGHAPLSPKEVVPQLAFLAYHLMREQKQTATAHEILTLLEEARENMPQIRRYARDTPDAFLKRVELRSSLLVEAGHQREGAELVPFYQFRHLTFQEYLAAVAAAEGHYLGYDKSHTVLTPLANYLIADSWKEVIPMSAVLAGKQGEAILAALVEDANAAVAPPRVEGTFSRPPDSVSRIVQCLVEESQAAPETLNAALDLVAIHCQACESPGDWRSLSRGPYGGELIHHAWSLYARMDWEAWTWLDATCAALSVHAQPEDYWKGESAPGDLRRRLESEERDERGLALLTCAGLRWYAAKQDWLHGVSPEATPLAAIEPHIFRDDPALWHAAVWARVCVTGYMQHSNQPSSKLLDRLFDLWAAHLGKTPSGLATPFGLADIPVMPRRAWRPKLTADQVTLVRSAMDLPAVMQPDSAAACMVAFHARDVCSDEELAAAVARWWNDRAGWVDALLPRLGEPGRRQRKQLDAPR